MAHKYNNLKGNINISTLLFFGIAEKQLEDILKFYDILILCSFIIYFLFFVHFTIKRFFTCSALRIKDLREIENIFQIYVVILNTLYLTWHSLLSKKLYFFEDQTLTTCKNTRIEIFVLSFKKLFLISLWMCRNSISWF